jgi:hypothetical protein
MTKMIVGIVVALTIGVAGCQKETPPPAPAPAPKPQVQAPPPASLAVTVTNISLGKAIGPDKKVTAPTDAFAKSDTIYAVVETSGSGNATLKAKWTYHKGDKTASVSESSQTISATGTAASEFHISKPDGWPTGEYRVEIFLDDKPVSTKTFVVK